MKTLSYGDKMMPDKNRKLTIYDISEKTGVSIATVSRVLNGATNVKRETKAAVESVIREMGYTPNVFARGLGLDTMKTIGILCADSSDTYLAKAVYYIEEQLRENNYDSLLCCTGYEAAGKRKALDLLLSKKVDAAILVGSTFLEASERGNKYINCAAAQIPVMMLNASMDYPNVYCVFCDDFAATKQATERLIDRGCKKILYLSNSKTYSAKKKRAGFIAALEERRRPVSEAYIRYCETGREDISGAIEYLDKLWNDGITFDAIVTAEDILAVAAVKFAAKKGLSIPKDLKVIGYNNSLLATVTSPEITSVDNRLKPMCDQLVETLLNVLSGREMPKKCEFSGELVIRGSI